MIHKKIIKMMFIIIRVKIITKKFNFKFFTFSLDNTNYYIFVYFLSLNWHLKCTKV